MGSPEGKLAIFTGGVGVQGVAGVRLFLAKGAKLVFTDVAEEAGQRLAAELGAEAMFLSHGSAA